ncbi:MAG: putative Zn-dependent protease, minimal metalloprotease (MMP)-like domain [Candidatus Peribacteria bacterium]|nr:putative Zn-dependent protease, minimal metalloprotease (MMP)-like domain [Candidatus Peribacteria bacterium]
MDHASYETIIQDAISALPDQIRDRLNDVIIVIEQEAPPRQRGILLGLYEGVPLTAWGRGEMNGKLPDKITLFQQSIEQVAGTEERIPDIVRETLWHEVAHYFGFDHDHIGKMEERWRAKRQQ